MSVRLAWLAAVIVSACLLAPALARDLGQWSKTDPELSMWFQSLRQPDNPQISCCGEADSYWADDVRVERDSDGNAIVVATVTDTRPDEPLGRVHVPPGTRIIIPPHKITWKHGNPTGHTIVFLGAQQQLFCFIQAGGV